MDPIFKLTALSKPYPLNYSNKRLDGKDETGIFALY
jgi:hypothetical protein